MLKRPNWWLMMFGILMIYLTYYLDQYGALSLLPQVVLGWIGSYSFIRSFWVPKDKANKVIEKKAFKKGQKSNRNYAVYLLAFLLMGLLFVPPAMAQVSTNYFMLSSTQDFNNGTLSNVSTESTMYSQGADYVQLAAPGNLNTTGLVSYWQFENDTVDETYLNNLTNVGADYSSSGKFGGCYDFVAANLDNMYKSGKVSDSTSGSLSFWLNFDSAPAAGSFVMFSYGGGDVAFFRVRLVTDGAYGKLYVENRPTATGTYSGVYETNATMVPAVWYHIVVVSDGSSYAIYRNGQLSDITIDTANNGNWYGDISALVPNYSVVGGFYYNGAYSLYYDGFIDEPRLYNSSLNSSQITDLYNSGLQYYQNGSWSSPDISSGFGLCSDYYTNITFNNNSVNTYITKVQWLQNSTVFAEYQYNLTTGTYKNITEADLTIGTFNGTTGNYSIKIFLYGGGASSVHVDTVSGMGDVIVAPAAAAAPAPAIPVSNVPPNHADRLAAGLGFLRTNPEVAVFLVLVVLGTLFLVFGRR